VIERFDSWPESDVPPYHYGSHYSSSHTICHYLVRIEPFTSLHIVIQDGRFDSPDRMFHSVKTAWMNSLHDMGDVKELIPEFFYLPEFLRNSENFDFGLKQSGEKIDNVVLPPWAKTPEEFIYKHRQALESEYVSNNLHNWIDLIFGYKQRGQDAIDAVNVFHHLTYEGTVDVDNIEDPVEKNFSTGSNS